MGNSWGLSEADLAPVMQRLAQAEKNLGNVKFVIGRASTAEETVELLNKAGPDAPVLAISADIFGLSNFNRDNAVMPAIFKQGRPVAVFHMPVIGGHDWCLVNPWREEGHRWSMCWNLHGLAVARFSLPGVFTPERPRDPRCL